MGSFKDLDYLDLKTLSFIGGQLSRDEPRFKMYAKLGFEKARQLAAVECVKKYLSWKDGLKGVDPDIKNLLDLCSSFLEELGISELFPTLKELTRITMIQGDKQKFVRYPQKPGS